MIAGWIIYCLIVSALVAIVAAGADEFLTRHGRPARGVWLLAIVASLFVPATTLVLQQRTPEPIVGAADAHIASGILERVRDRERVERERHDQAMVARVPHLRTPQWFGADRVVVWLIILCISVATARVAVDSISLFRERRGWRMAAVDDQAVFVSSTLGPAIVGLVHPAIVVPHWVSTLSADERKLMLAHEREHLRAHDGLLSAGGLLAVLFMPWSPAIWWMFRRLRTAIEVDCDRRVLRAFPDVALYGNLLVDVAARAADRAALTITGFSEHAGSLARRIRAMTAGDSRRDPATQWRRVVPRAASLGAAAAIIVILPPLPAARETALPRATDPLPRPKSVADSIGEDLDAMNVPPMARRARMLAAAHDLPTAFVVEDPGSTDNALPLAGRCPTALRDPRTGTRLQLKVSSTSAGAIAQRGDTAWTRLAQVGLYRVALPGAYGVQARQLLRVSCGAATRRTIARQAPPTSATSDLDSKTDDRAQRIAIAVDSATHRPVRAVELYPGRLNVAIADSNWLEMRWDPWPTTRLVWSVARDVLGQAAMPETLAFSVRFDTGGGITMFYYTSHPR